MATAKIYGPVIGQLLSGAVNWQGGTVKAMLLASTYTPNQDTHEFLDDIDTHQVAGAGYTAGGITVTGKTSSYAPVANIHSISCNDLVLSAATLTFRYMVFYVSTGSAATSPLVCYIDFAAGQSIAAQNVTFVVPVTGLAQFTVAA